MSTDLSLRFLLSYQLPNIVHPCIPIIEGYCEGTLFYCLQDKRHLQDQRTSPIEPNSIYLRITQYLTNSELIKVSSCVSKSCGFYQLRDDENMWRARAVVQLTEATADFVFKDLGNLANWKKVCVSLTTIGINDYPSATEWTQYIIIKKGNFRAGNLDGQGTKTRKELDQNGAFSIITGTEIGTFKSDELHGQGKRTSPERTEEGQFSHGRFLG